MSVQRRKESEPQISKYWLELNNWKLPLPGHIGICLWGPIAGKHRSEYERLKKSIQEFKELTIIHYLGSKHREKNGFIGESRLVKEDQDFRIYTWKTLVQVLRRLFEDRGYSEAQINLYLREAEKYAGKFLKNRGNRPRFFLFLLRDYREYNRPVSYKEIKFMKNKPLQGRYLIALKRDEYQTINRAGFSTKGIDKIIGVGSAKLEKTVFAGLVDYREFREYVIHQGGYYPDDVLESIVMGYNKGKHILLVGPPGVGKSFLAELLADYLGYELFKTTASSSWTRYDFIGGPIITREGFRWRSGVFLKALARHIDLSSSTGEKGVLLLIDELNRCEADKVLSEFFSIYPGIDPEQWRIPDALVEEIQSYTIIDKEASKVLEYLADNGNLPWGFRVIATMNTWDITHLYTLGYALLRRFHIVKVVPRKIDDDNIETFKKALLNRAKRIIKKIGNVDNHRLNEIVERISSVSKLFINNGFPLGMAYIVEAVIDAYNIVMTKYLGKSIDDAVDIALANVLGSMLNPKISKIMLPKEYIDILKKISENRELNEKYKKTAALVREIASKS